MAVLERIEGPAPGAAVGSWLPARYTRPLSGSEQFRSDGEKLLRFAERFFSVSDSETFSLDEWQRWLIRHVLERYPDDWPVEHLRGQLRYRRVVISMGRQNGKSLLAALFALYFLCLHVRGPQVLGMASVDRQAKIVYGRVKYAIDKSAELSRVLRATETRGIHLRDGTGIYQTLPAREESAQGEPATGVIYDELHLGQGGIWDALLLAMRAKTNAMMIGITTAGDDSSDLLVRLYAEGDNALEGNDERMGFFCWEAPEPEGDEPELTEAGIVAANPAVACGRVPLDLVLSEAQTMWADQRRGPDGLTGRQRVVRYTLNRFINGAADSWTNTHQWAASARPGLDLGAGQPVYALARTENWEWASITAVTKTGDTYATRLVASIETPTPDLLVAAAEALAQGRATFVVDRRSLDGVGRTMSNRGLRVWRLTESEMANAAKLTHGLISRRAVTHGDDALVRLQQSRARRKTVGDSGWRVSPELSSGDIDTVLGLIGGVYVAASEEDTGVQLT